MSKLGAEWALGRDSTEVVVPAQNTNHWDDDPHTQHRLPAALLEPTYDLKLTDLFDEPLEVLEGVSVVLKAEQSPMTIRGYQFVQYVTGHRIWVYVDLVWGVGVQPWLIADTSAVRQIDGGITTLLQRAGYTNLSHGGPALRRHEVEQSKESGWEGYRHRFFDLGAVRNYLATGQGWWDEEIKIEDGLPYLDLYFDSGRSIVLDHPEGYLLRHEECPYIEHLIGKKLIVIRDQLVSEEVAATYYGGELTQWVAEVLEPTPFQTPYTGKLTGDKLRLYANLPGFVTMDTVLDPIVPNPEEWVLLRCRSLRFSDTYMDFSISLLKKYFEEEITDFHTSTGKMKYVWAKPANSFDWECIEGKKSDEADNIATLQPKYGGWFAGLLRLFGLRRA